MDIIKFFFKRTIYYLPTFIFVIIFTFVITRIMPGDPIRSILGDKATPEQIESLTKLYHVDKTIFEQFIIWLKDLLKLDFGESMFWNTNVNQLVISRLEPTLILTIIGFIISVGIGVPMGYFSGTLNSKFFSGIYILYTLLAISIPSFVVAVFAIETFSVNLGWFPTSGYDSLKSSNFIHASYQLLLPGIVLGIMQSGQIARMTRNSMMDIMNELYLNTARSIGIKESIVLNKYAFRNAIHPIIVVIGFALASLFGGAAVVEQIFHIPGIGGLLITAILNRDYPTIQACLLLIASIFFIINLLTDLIIILIQPDKDEMFYEKK